MKYPVIIKLLHDLVSGKMSLIQAIIFVGIIAAIGYGVKCFYSLLGKRFPTEKQQEKEMEEMKNKKFKELTLYWKIDRGLTWAFKIIMALIIISFMTIFIYNLVRSY
jgi:hypothetical protein